MKPGDDLAAQASADPSDVAALYDDWAPTGYDADLAAWGYDAPARAADRLVDLLDQTETGRRATDGTATGETATDEAATDGPVPRRAVLDAGCGTGLAGVELQRRGVGPIVGGDFSPASVEVARSAGVYDDVVHLDLNAPLDVADGVFRAILSVGVFSYLTDSESTIRELLRVVEPGGAVVFTQRTDLWDQRGFDELLERLAAEGLCEVDVSPPRPYLPEHPEFGGEIGIRYATLIRCLPAST